MAFSMVERSSPLAFSNGALSDKRGLETRAPVSDRRRVAVQLVGVGSRTVSVTAPCSAVRGRGTDPHLWRIYAGQRHVTRARERGA
jgi:hypothetical protein